MHDFIRKEIIRLINSSAVDLKKKRKAAAKRKKTKVYKKSKRRVDK